MPNPHARKTSTQNFRSSYWRSYPKRNLHTARRQTRARGRQQRKISATPIGAATQNAIYTQHAAKPARQEDINAKFSQLLLAKLPRMQFTHSTPPNPHARKTSTQNFHSSYWHSYPKRNLHTARRQTRMPGTHQRKLFPAPIGAATPNAIYTQHAAKPARQEHISAKFSQLPLAQLPRKQFTHSTPPNPHVANTSTQTFSSSYWHSYPKRNLHTARRQTRMPAGHQRKIFAAPFGTATPNAIYTQRTAKPACQQNINAKFSQLLLAQLPRTQFTHSNPKKHPRPARDLHAARRQSHRPGRHQRKIKSHSSYCHSYPKHNLHTARRRTRMPRRHQHKIFATPIGTATPNAIYTQRTAKPACQQDINAKFSHLVLAQLPRKQFTTARRQTHMPRTHQRKLFPAPIGTATPNAIYTQHAAKPACQEHINANFFQLLLAQLPQTQFTHSTPPNPHASKTPTQNFRSSHWHSYPKHNLHTARRQTRMPGTHQRKIFAAPIGAATLNAIYTQHAAKPACQQDINAKFSQLLLAQLPRTKFTHSKPQKQQRPARDLHTARRQTRMPGTHQRKIFAAPIGTATPNTIYTQRAAKPARREHISAKFSQLPLAQLPRTQFTHSTPPNAFTYKRFRAHAHICTTFHTDSHTNAFTQTYTPLHTNVLTHKRFYKRTL